MTRYFCVNCDKGLSLGQKLNSNGKCPLCKYKDPSAAAVVATYSKTARWIKTAPWWKFWGEQGYWQYKAKKK